MPCYHPLAAWYAPNRELRPGRRRTITFRLEPNHLGQLNLPCGRCIGCRLERSRQWAIRCMHEAQMHSTNYFATLTYDQDHVPKDGSLRPEDYVLFMKRLRKALPPGVRYFQCGEYGDQLARPHHHALLFNAPFNDVRLLPNQETRLYSSRQLDQLWGQGRTILGRVTFESAAYVARYSLKKVTGPAAEAHYAGRHPEYCTMSRRPGIGSTWLDKFRNDVYPGDAIILRGGTESRPPRYYDSKLPHRVLAALKLRRELQARDDPESTGPRLIVREAVTTARTATFTRRNKP